MLFSWQIKCVDQEVLVDGLRRELASNIEAMLAKESFENLEELGSRDGNGLRGWLARHFGFEHSR